MVANTELNSEVLERTKAQQELAVYMERLTEMVQERTEELSVTNQKLLNEIDEREKLQVERESLHEELVDASRLAGQAEVAADVLHHAGNALNSVNISVSRVKMEVKRLRLSSIDQLSELIEEHQEDLVNFLVRDERGRSANFANAFGTKG